LQEEDQEWQGPSPLSPTWEDLSAKWKRWISIKKSHRPGHHITVRVTTLPSGSPTFHRPGHHTIRPGHQNLQEETHTLSASSFNDEEIPVWNFDPKLNSNLALIEEAERQEEVSKKSKKIKKNFKN
jgi:hypothetical protein